MLYEIKIDNTGDGVEDISYQFRFDSATVNPNTVLGMAAVNQNGVIESLTDPDYNEYQTYSILRRSNSGPKLPIILASNLRTPPSHVGGRATPNYEANLASQAVYNLPGGGRVSPVSRRGFYIDVGGVFDILNMSAIDNAPNFDQGGFDSPPAQRQHPRVEVPISALTRDGRVPASPTAANASSACGRPPAAAQRKLSGREGWYHPSARSGRSRASAARSSTNSSSPSASRTPSIIWPRRMTRCWPRRCSTRNCRS